MTDESKPGKYIATIDYIRLDVPAGEELRAVKREAIIMALKHECNIRFTLDRCHYEILYESLLKHFFTVR
jgi:hypothetical protein